MAVIVAFILNAGLNFVVGLIVAKLLGPAQFGVFALASAGAVVLNTLLFEWLRLSATRFYSGRVRIEEPWIRHGLDRAYFIVAIGLFAMAILVGGLDFWLGRDPQSRAAIMAGTALVAIGIGLFDYHAALARARFDGGLYLKLVAAKNLLAFVTMTSVAWFYPEPIYVLLAGGVSQLLAVAILRAPLRDASTAAEHPRLSEAQRLFLVYGLPLIAANGIYQFLPFLNRWSIADQAGFAEAGYFSLAADVASRSFGTLGTALDLLLFQLAVQAEEHHGRAAAEAQIGRNAAIVVALMLPCAAGFWTVLPALQELVIPEAFRGPFATYAALLIPGLFCLALTNFALNPVFQIRRRTMPVIGAALVGLAVNALGLVLLPPLMGAEGVAAAQSAGMAAAMLVLGSRALAGRERLVLPWRDLAAAALATLVMGLCLTPLRHAAPWLALGIGIPAGGAIYAALVWYFDIAGLREIVLARWRTRRVLPAG
ncbi:MAG: polysaccharide biosynthesis C-terminal domain-containing protein [Methylobacterium sp.]|uniref:lipopolysaccharide biosynthesis protein n=1 Tax=Methylobacterium sp. TaxID=409 RepID=UPI0025FDBBC1|nr:polysaccharide biosynthesis C-terminal domain-containing protein [Methylobacterium sp.]MBX9932462.1 polysaccharide biosynthesis C-terminal domain-containing protein [Methylobacterium sp.]